MAGNLSTMLKHVLPAPLTQYIRKVRYTKAMSGNLDHYDPEMPFIRKLVHPGEAVVDIGANMGWYTRFLSEVVGPAGLVLSVEPILYTYAILEYMVKSLKLGNVRTFQRAVSDSDADVVMELPQASNGEPDYYLARIIPSSPSPSDAGAAQAVSASVRVPAITLPGLFAQAGKSVSFVKVDVEGFELAMLRSARDFVAQVRPIWLIEIWGNPDEEGSKCKETFEFMQALGYGAYCVFNNALVPFSEGAVTANGNYFFLTPEQVERYKAETR